MEGLAYMERGSKTGGERFYPGFTPTAKDGFYPSSLITKKKQGQK